MKKLKLFALAVLIAGVLAFGACGEQDEQHNDTQVGDGGATVQDTETPDRQDDEEHNDGDLADTSGFVVSTRRENLPERDFDGMYFTFLVEDPLEKVWTYTNMIVEEMSGVVIDDAFYRRNTIVEERFNIRLRQTPVALAQNQNFFNQSVLAGDYSFDVAFISYGAAANLAIQNRALNLNELPYIDLSMPWWDQNSIRDLSIAGQSFIVASDMTIGDNDNTWLIYFDKQHVSDLGLDCPYQLVRDGLWTMEAMLSMMRAAHVVDPVTGQNEINGLRTHDENVPALWIAGGHTAIGVDTHGMPYLNIMNERFVAVFDMLREIMLDNSTANTHPVYISAGLRNGDVLFATEILSFVREYRENERDFGILPMPKFDVYQDSIHTYVALSAPLAIVPMHHPDPEGLSIILEALAAEGHRTIMPAYYLVAIENQFTRDLESAEMLNIAFDTRLYDMAVVFNFGLIHSRLVAAHSNPHTSIASLYESSLRVVQAQIERAFSAFDEG